MKRPLLLDLFCKAGGASQGYSNAGFEVIGLDIEKQKHYPFDFIQGDALKPPIDLNRFDAFHASPPCQAYSFAAFNQRAGGKIYPDLIELIRRLLASTGKPWVIENVPNATPLRPDLILCGSHFGLPIVRHRLFEFSSPQFFLLPPCSHDRDIVTVCGNGTPSASRQTRIRRGLSPNAPVEEKRRAMGISWQNREELAQAIPPAYTAFIGKILLSMIDHE